MKKGFRGIFFNTRERLILREFGDRSFRLLDAGMGNNSPFVIKSVFPNCEYSGIDITRNYNNDKDVFRLMAAFYELDLTQLEYQVIPDAYFDALVMSHVIEHLRNGDEVIAGLLPKLKVGGVIYIEYPGRRSMWFPSMKGTLNFHDDPTHVRVYSRGEIFGLLAQYGCRVLKNGVRRNPLRVLALPAILLRNYRTRGYLEGSDFWELLGFAEYTFARKTRILLA